MSYSRVRAWDPERQQMGWVMRWGGIPEPKTREEPTAEYKALHPDLTIRDSPIDGLGVFAKADIPKDTVLGVSHVEQYASAGDRYQGGFIRTPLGGFINHSDTPNSRKVQMADDNTYRPLQNGLTSCTMAVQTSRDIQKDEEITVFYTLYAP